MHGLTTSLIRLGHQCDVVTLNRLFSNGTLLEPTDSIDGINIYRLPYFGSNRYPITPSIVSFLSSYDLIHIHAIDFFVDFLVLTARWHCKPLVVNTHGGFFHTKWLLPLKKLYFHTVTRQTLRYVQATICVSQQDYDLFRTIVSPKQLHVIENGTNIQPFLAVKKDIQPGLLVGIGRLVENKGIAMLIELLSHIVTDYPNVQLVWIGDDERQQIPYFQSLAQSYGVKEHIRFTGRISQEDLLDWLAKAHLFVSASTYEAFGISTIEAMSSATVPIVTPVGIHPQVVVENENGFSYTWNNMTKAADKFQYALSLDISQILQMGANARHIASRFSWENVVHSYEILYHAILKM